MLQPGNVPLRSGVGARHSIAAVCLMPPTLVASSYGMNFKHMPEYDWTWGYPYALAVVVITALLPLIWFKWKDWI